MKFYLRTVGVTNAIPVGVGDGQVKKNIPIFLVPSG